MVTRYMHELIIVTEIANQNTRNAVSEVEILININIYFLYINTTIRI